MDQQTNDGFNSTEHVTRPGSIYVDDSHNQTTSQPINSPAITKTISFINQQESNMHDNTAKRQNEKLQNDLRQLRILYNDLSTVHAITLKQYDRMDKELNLLRNNLKIEPSTESSTKDTNELKELTDMVLVQKQIIEQLTKHKEQNRRIIYNQEQIHSEHLLIIKKKNVVRQFQ